MGWGSNSSPRSLRRERPRRSSFEAYRDDAQHFLEQDELIEAFEAAIWAWAWLEIGQERGILPT